MSYTDETINAYLAGTLSEKEKEEFEVILTSDTDLQQRVRFLRELDQMLTEDDWAITDPGFRSKKAERYLEFLESEEGRDLNQTVLKAADSYFDEVKTPQGKQVAGWFGRLSIAASFIIIAAVAVFFLLGNPSSSDLYMAYKDSGRLPSLVNRSTTDELNEFIELYDKRKNKEAISWLKGYMQTSSSDINPQLFLYKGQLHLRLHEDDKALETYERLLKSETVDSDKAYWYMAMVHLKNDNVDAAKEALNNLIKSEINFQKQEAKQILDKLD